MAGVAEALALGQQLGIDAKTLSNIFNSSTARCWSRYASVLIWYRLFFKPFRYLK
jgi:3-hydroxyisobutyrate dehydrogenase-like beta-hydroxyacid dehydrogenase